MRFFNPVTVLEYVSLQIIVHDANTMAPRRWETFFQSFNERKTHISKNIIYFNPKHLFFLFVRRPYAL